MIFEYLPRVGAFVKLSRAPRCIYWAQSSLLVTSLTSILRHPTGPSMQLAGPAARQPGDPPLHTSSIYLYVNLQMQSFKRTVTPNASQCDSRMETATCRGTASPRPSLSINPACVLSKRRALRRMSARNQHRIDPLRKREEYNPILQPPSDITGDCVWDGRAELCLC